jgi:hypothetical protein
MARIEAAMSKGERMATQSSSESVVPIYVINLDRDIARLQFVQMLFLRHGLLFERVEAVDGQRLSELRGVHGSFTRKGAL